jgi:AcrR family transcriptional regulator
VLFGDCLEKEAMAFGKPGRPPEDRLARRQEIYEAVAPLILSLGARQLSMREAAHAACVSIGGLYHYFPTKRELVLYGLNSEARDRLCREYREQLTKLSTWSRKEAIEAYLDHSIQMFNFVRPAARAVLELGASELQATLDAGMSTNVAELAETLQFVAPEMSQTEREALGRAIRRVSLGALLDERTDFDEVRDQLRALIDGYLSRSLEQPAAVSA